MPRKSTGDYPPNSPEISKRTKDEAGNRCIRCNHIADIPAGYMLTVHHLDLNKSNCEWWNLAALCQRCHLHIQGKLIIERPYMFEHTAWFKPYVAGYYAFTNGLPHNETFVMSHLDELLDFGRPIQLFSNIAIA
jgi:hypothetical protein